MEFFKGQGLQNGQAARDTSGGECGEDNTTNIYFCMKFKSDQKEDQFIVNL